MFIITATCPPFLYPGEWDWEPKLCLVDEVVAPVFEVAATIAQRDGIDFKCLIEVGGSDWLSFNMNELDWW